MEAPRLTHGPALLFPNGQVMNLAVLSADLNPMATFQQASTEDIILQGGDVTLARRLEAIGRVDGYEQERKTLKHQWIKSRRVVDTVAERELDRTQPTLESLMTCWELGDGFES
jgi:hypothetical protein